MAKTNVKDELGVGVERRNVGPSPISNAPDEGSSTPPIDFDDWAADVFSSFGGVDVEVPNSSSTATSFQPPSLSSGILSEKSSGASNDDYSQNRKRRHSRQSTEKQASLDGEVQANTKKKSDFVPVSRRKKKPKGMPKRPLSAYNLYFQAERTKIIANQVETQGPRIGFEGLGKIIGKQWRDLSASDKKKYDELAEKDSERYRKEMDAYHEMKTKKLEEEDKRAAARTPVLSSISSSATSVRHTIFDGQQKSLQMLSNPNAFAHPQDSMISGISSQPVGTTSISYRPIHVDHPPPPPRHALQHNNIMAALNPSAAVDAGGAPPTIHFANPTRAETPSYAASPGNNNCPMPQGMEVVLSDRNGIDRKYRVQYTCYSMTRENANKYIESLTGGEDSNATVQAPTAGGVTGPFREYGEWGV